MIKLSFSLPKYADAMDKYCDEISVKLHLQDELLKLFPPVQVSHTGTTRWINEPNILEAPYKLHKNTTSGNVEIVTQTHVIKFKEFLLNLMIPIREKVKEHTIENINQTCEVTGNKIDAVDRNAWDAYIEAIEKMKMIFDDNSNPIFYIHPPEFHEKLRKTLPTIEQLSKVQEVFQRKREEISSKKQSRRLSKSNSRFNTPTSHINAHTTELKSNLSLPKYDNATIQLIREIKDGLEKLDDILGKMKKVPVSHGGITRQVSEPQILDIPMKKFSAEISFEIDCFRNTDAEQFQNSICGFVEIALGQMKELFFDSFPKICDATGNSINAEGKNFWDAYLEMIETTEMHFDENGDYNHKIIVHPDTAKKIQENPPTPEQLAKGKEIIERKRKEFYAQKCTRRLS